MKILKPLWITGGFISLGLGITGIPLPILPTTPFLLFSAFFIIKASLSPYTSLININECFFMVNSSLSVTPTSSPSFSSSTTYISYFPSFPKSIFISFAGKLISLVSCQVRRTVNNRTY